MQRINDDSYVNDAMKVCFKFCLTGTATPLKERGHDETNKQTNILMGLPYEHKSRKGLNS